MISVMGDWYFTYDAVDRLTSATPDITAPTKYLNNYACWTYDAYGNRTQETFSTTPCASITQQTPGVLTTYIQQANGAPLNNRISSSTLSPNTLAANSYVYDANGNTLYDGRNQYWYDAEVPGWVRNGCQPTHRNEQWSRDGAQIPMRSFSGLRVILGRR